MSTTDIPFKTITEVIETELALVSKSQASAYLGCTPATIIKRVHTGALEGYMVPQAEGGKSALHVTLESVRLLKKEAEVFAGKIEKIVLKRCKEKKLITYGDLMELVGLTPSLSNDRNEISRALAKISIKSFEQYGVMLSALVVNKKKQMPSDGFRELAWELGADLGEAEGWFDKYKVKVFETMSKHGV